MNQKLCLVIEERLKGAFTWVACVICWYRLQSTVIKKFNQELNKFGKQKEQNFNTFWEIAKGNHGIEARVFSIGFFK